MSHHEQCRSTRFRPVRRIVAPLLAVFGVAVGAAACVGASEVTPPCTVSAIAVSVSLSTLTVGQSTQGNAAYSVQNCSPNPTLTWGSDSTSVVTVSPTGLITAVAAGGPVRIRASAGGQSGSVSVSVARAP